MNIGLLWSQPGWRHMCECDGLTTFDSMPIEIALIILPAMTAQYERTTFCIIIPRMAIPTSTTMVMRRPMRRPIAPAMKHPITMPALAVPEPADCHDDGMILGEPSEVGGPYQSAISCSERAQLHQLLSTTELAA